MLMPMIKKGLWVFICLAVIVAIFKAMPSEGDGLTTWLNGTSKNVERTIKEGTQKIDIKKLPNPPKLIPATPAATPKNSNN